MMWSNELWDHPVNSACFALGLKPVSSRVTHEPIVMCLVLNTFTVHQVFKNYFYLKLSFVKVFLFVVFVLLGWGSFEVFRGCQTGLGACAFGLTDFLPVMCFLLQRSTACLDTKLTHTSFSGILGMPLFCTEIPSMLCVMGTNGEIQLYELACSVGIVNLMTTQ